MITMDVDSDATVPMHFDTAATAADSTVGTIWVYDRPRRAYIEVWGRQRDSWHPDPRVRRRRENKDLRCEHAREMRALWPAQPRPESIPDSLLRYETRPKPSTGPVNRFICAGATQGAPHAKGACRGPQGPP